MYSRAMRGGEASSIGYEGREGGTTAIIPTADAAESVSGTDMR